MPAHRKGWEATIVDGVAQVPLSRGEVALVDEGDLHLVEGRAWHVNTGHRTLYAISHKPVRSDGSDLMHHLIAGRGVDHINHNGLDNRRCNLRPATVSQNMANRRPKRGGSSRYKGVSWCKNPKRWVVSVSKDNDRIWMRGFEDEVEAALAYDRLAIELHGEFAYLNFPYGQP